MMEEETEGTWVAGATLGMENRQPDPLSRLLGSRERL